MRVEVGGVLFFSDFDSGNLARVEEVHLVTESDLHQGLVQINRATLTVRPKSANSIHLYNNCTSATEETRNKSRRRRSKIEPIETLDQKSSKSKARSCDSMEQSGVEENHNGYSSYLFPSFCTTHDNISQLKNHSTTVSGKQESVVKKEFNLWTQKDCGGTEYENLNRTWFYFGVKCTQPNLIITFNIKNLNKQSKLMSQGMAPVFKVTPGQELWIRIPDKPTYSENDQDFTLSFNHQLSGEDSCTYFAFTYPYSYTECQEFLTNLDNKFGNGINYESQNFQSEKAIYYSRELLCLTKEGKRIDLLSITSYKGITLLKEERLPGLFPDKNKPTTHKFKDKKVVFLSSRVHPGETQSSFVLDGFIKFILLESDPRAISLRDTFIFKIVPILNPDGVFHGHYRTDLEGVNLNRTYLNCNLQSQPSIFALRSLLLYYHWEYSTLKIEESAISILEKFNTQLDEDNIDMSSDELSDFECKNTVCGTGIKKAWNKHLSNKKRKAKLKPWQDPSYFVSPSNSGLAYFIDLHGHASKRGCFLFGNYFNHLIDKADCMLLAKLMSINYPHFDFAACNFTAQNMTQKGVRDRLSKEGSARVSIYYLTKIIHSYTLECNFNTGRIVNQLPPLKNGSVSVKPLYRCNLPPKYTPKIFEDAGEALAISILDACDKNPVSRLPLSTYQDLDGVKDWLIQYVSGGKTVSAWRHPRIRHWNATKKLDANQIPGRSFIENGPSQHKKGSTQDLSKSKNSHSAQSQRNSISYSKLDTFKRIPKPDVSICVSHHDEAQKTYLLLPKESVSTIYSAKPKYQKKFKSSISGTLHRKGSSENLLRKSLNKKSKECGGATEASQDLYIYGTVCHQLSGKKLRPRSVNV